MKRIISILVILLEIYILGAKIYSDDISKARITEGTLRRILIRSSMPVYPKSSIQKRKSGVAVASVVINHKGFVESIKIIQAPDLAIRRSVRNALMKWKAYPTYANGKIIKITSKVTFYFVIKRGVGKVENP